MWKRLSAYYVTNMQANLSLGAFNYNSTKYVLMSANRLC